MLVTESVCNVVWGRNPTTEKLGFVVFDYQWKDSETDTLSLPETRFPAGMVLSGEGTEEASIRKLREETGLVALETERIGVRLAGAFHIKYLFLIDFLDCRGSFRTEVLVKNNDVMGPPGFSPLLPLVTRLAPTHRWAFDTAVRKLRRRGIV